MSEQTEAQRLADWLERRTNLMLQDRQAAAELRRLDMANAELKREAWDWSKALEAEIAKSAAAVAAEREACALVAEQGFRYAKDGYTIADDIRARGAA